MLRWNLVSAGRRGAALSALGCLLVAMLALAACGKVAQADRGVPPAAPTATARVIPGGVMAVRPCPGQVSDATSLGALALTLTPTHSSGSLRVGELAQVRLPASLHWTLTGQPEQLAGVGEAGGQDTSLNVCYWTFRAVTPGTITLYYSGAQPCDPPAVVCSNAITEQDFTITVS